MNDVLPAVISGVGSEVAATIEAVEEVVERKENHDAAPHGLSETSLLGTYRGGVLSKRLKKIADFLEDEGNQFEIRLTLKEIPNSADVDEKEEILKKVLGLLMDK
ncbi:hypothetical protein NSQ26_09970 [Bacillus sp. FSL W7-1360]